MLTIFEYNASPDFTARAPKEKKFIPLKIFTMSLWHLEHPL